MNSFKKNPFHMNAIHKVHFFVYWVKQVILLKQPGYHKKDHDLCVILMLKMTLKNLIHVYMKACSLMGVGVGVQRKIKPDLG